MSRWEAFLHIRKPIYRKASVLRLQFRVRTQAYLNLDRGKVKVTPADEAHIVVPAGEPHYEKLWTGPGPFVLLS